MKSTPLGLYLRTLRKDRNETLHEVSRGTDIDSPLISKIERGDRLPTTAQAKKFAKYFKISEKELLSQLTAEQIIKKYGATKVTVEAISIVSEQISKYHRSKK